MKEKDWDNNHWREDGLAEKGGRARLFRMETVIKLPLLGACTFWQCTEGKRGQCSPAVPTVQGGLPESSLGSLCWASKRCLSGPESPDSREGSVSSALEAGTSQPQEWSHGISHILQTHSLSGSAALSVVSPLWSLSVPVPPTPPTFQSALTPLP